ncbi:MAG TPA: DoxX family protein [Alphaproteobacteria bacterium]|jgi:putative oxidoreductase|nr:DoxX family protein [Alphaproteobacteria bacterium]
MNNVLLLVGRVLIALLFLMTAWRLSPNAGYLTSLGVPSPAIASWIAIIAEFAIVVSLVLGIWTKWGALLGIVYVVIATALAHRFWAVPEAQYVAQYTNFTKNLAILGGLILIYVAGAGELSVDHSRASKGAAA